MAAVGGDPTDETAIVAVKHDVIADRGIIAGLVEIPAAWHGSSFPAPSAQKTRIFGVPSQLADSIAVFDNSWSRRLGVDFENCSEPTRHAKEDG